MRLQPGAITRRDVARTARQDQRAVVELWRGRLRGAGDEAIREDFRLEVSMPKYFEPRLRAELLEGTSCASRAQERKLTYVSSRTKVTHMEKTQIYFRKEELNALREAAARSGRSIAELVRDAVRKVVLKPSAAGPVAIWNGRPKRASVEHDSVHDKP